MANPIHKMVSDVGGTQYSHILIGAGDSASIDAFSRLRVSDPQTLFDSKQIFDNQPAFWNEAETSGSGTSTAHSVNRASTTLSVTADTAGTRVRQTYRRFNYQPGKSQLIFQTFSMMDSTTGITKRLGYFDDNNGIFLQSKDGVMSIVKRSYVTGSAVDTVVNQSDWNLNKLDGSDRNPVSLSPEKANILVVDLEWLGVGRVRVGFVIDGMVFYAHEFSHANSINSVSIRSEKELDDLLKTHPRIAALTAQSRADLAKMSLRSKK